jgi:tRNA dimethylallyltransferase
VGKSEIAYRLAKEMGAEILSVDAFQVYRGLPIGTNHPDPAWMRDVPHHLVACREPAESWSAPQFAVEALRILREKQAQGIPMIAVGGSGFYLRALLEGAPEGDAPDPAIRDMISQKVESLGIEGAHRWLQELDPQAAKRLHPNDSMRIRRALEKTFAPVTAPASRAKCWGAENANVFGLECPREILDSQLRLRTSTMWKGGLIDETRMLLHQNVPPDAPVWGAIGYREASEFLNGSLKENDALEAIFRRTRQYAKRQWTWFRHHHQTQWIDLNSFPDIPSVVLYLSDQLKPLLRV